MKRVALLSIALLAAMLPSLPAHADPLIQFLYPSVFSAEVPAPEVSNKNDVDDAIHLVAWVQDVPASPLVEFELQPAAGNAITVDGQRVGNSDTWENFFTVPGGLPDGPYTFAVRLFSDLQEVAADTQAVQLSTDTTPPPAAETLELTYPENGGTFGAYAPTGGRASGVVEATTSADAARVRILYSLSDPGNAPEWKQCGVGAPQARQVRIRCTLAQDDRPADVTAVAAVANTTPAPGDPSPAADESGDAHRVFGYDQKGSGVEITPSPIQANPGACQLLTLVATDQQGRSIAGANVDVHAVGPSDQLSFMRLDSSPVAEETHPFKAPDEAHSSTENTRLCSNGNFNESRKQGDHNVPGRDDTKHIESVDGTNNLGEFDFALRGDEVGSTTVEAWIDDNGNDKLESGEAFGGAQIGWGEPPPPPVTTLQVSPGNQDATRGQCVPVDFQAREGGNPLRNANIDIHITGPDTSVAFCDDIENPSVRRAPDQGDHTVDAHSDGTRHTEGETDTAGEFTVGVTANADEGSTQLTAWLDSTDDDILSGEVSGSATITWQPSGFRTISIDSNKDAARRGGRARIFGAIDGDDACSSGQNVVLKARRPGRRFRTIGSNTTTGEGDYSFTVTINKTKQYKTIAPAVGICERVSSNVITIRKKPAN